jgi:hypothetical protein
MRVAVDHSSYLLSGRVGYPTGDATKWVIFEKGVGRAKVNIGKGEW